MSFKPLVDQFAIVVNTAAREGERAVFQRSVTTGCRVGSHLKPCSGTGKIFRPDVFAECKKRVMPPQIFDCRFHAFVDLDLLNAGVALDVKNAIGNE